MSRSRSLSRSTSPECPRDQDPKKWKSLFIGYLPNHAKMDDVEDFFDGYGEIDSISLKPGYGFVVMKHRRDAEVSLLQSRARNFQCKTPEKVGILPVPRKLMRTHLFFLNNSRVK